MTWKSIFLKNLEELIKNNPHHYLQPRHPAGSAKGGEWKSDSGYYDTKEAMLAGEPRSIYKDVGQGVVPGEYGTDKRTKTSGNSWEDRSSLKEVQKQLSSIGIRLSSPQGSPSEQILTDRGNQIGSHMTEVFNNRPGIKNVLNKIDHMKRPLLVFEGSGRYSLIVDGSAVDGSFDISSNRISLPGGFKKKFNKSLSLNGKNFSVGNGLEDTFRHEFGHSLYYNKVLSNKTASFNQLFQKKGKEYFKKNVSKYGSTNASEAFAESFSAWTHPGYGKGKKARLPKEIEQYFDETFK